jgi:hypothetical protein
MEYVLQLIIGVLIPFAVSMTKRVDWPHEYKFALVFFLSLLTATIATAGEYVVNGVFDTGQFLQSMTLIFTTSQIIYQSVIKSFSLEDQLNPHAALIYLLKRQLSKSIASLDLEDARDFLDPDSPSKLVVTLQEEK